MKTDPTNQSPSRRQFGRLLATGAASAALGGRAPAIVIPDRARPAIEQGVASGDVSGRSALVWSRTDRPARMRVEYGTDPQFRGALWREGPIALPEDDFTARLVLDDLPPGSLIHYRVTFRDLDDRRVVSAPATGQFRAAPGEGHGLAFAWGGDTCGQGWGIDESRGGLTIYDAIRRQQPDFFLHSGDNIYADNPIEREVRLDDGSLWRNLVTEAKSKVAETLDEYRGNYRYNLLDAHLRRLQAEVPLIVQWDDHETVNNWFPGEILDDPRYAVKSVDLLAARARRAFFEYCPVRRHPDDLERIDRVIHYGPLLDVFVLDQRTDRGPNTANRQTASGPETAFHGASQLQRLKRQLLQSRATWKVIASDMPIGLIIGDGPNQYEGVANGDAGPPLGREREIAELLAFCQSAGVRNLVWLTADVHYAAAHYYDPERAQFSRFDPFWEFVAGPLHAGTFGPGTLDPTFGPQLKFRSIPEGMKPNRPPSEGKQFFGRVAIDGPSRVMTVSLHDATGGSLYRVELEPVSPR